ncbi:MAG: ABC transporter ATP-binding protein [Elusimicrobiota bacterium]
METYAIRTEKLTKVYKKARFLSSKLTPGVKDVNLEVNTGEVYALLGLNGTGKTTTIKLILGLLFPTEGSIEVFGVKMPNDEIRRSVGYLPELPYFYRNLTPREVLDLYGTLSGLNEHKRKQRCGEILELVRMTKYIDKRMGEFSKGMLQRIGIAQALLHDPQLLVFDEPVAGLDPVGIHEMRELLLNLKTQGKTLMFSSHIISEVEKISDRVGIMNNGQLAKVITQQEWVGKQDGLEKMFIDVVGENVIPR